MRAGELEIADVKKGLISQGPGEFGGFSFPGLERNRVNFEKIKEIKVMGVKI